MNTGPPLVSVRGLSKTFRPAGGPLATRRGRAMRALDDVSLDIARETTLGLVGESGSGKSTLGRCLLRLTPADAGTITWHERQGPAVPLHALGRKELRAFRRRMQVVFQDPYHSLNPARTVWQIVGESLFVQGGLKAGEIRARSAHMLRSVGMRDEHLDRRPHEFSGGQRQRIAIARALMAEPEFLVCDEVTSALDTRTQAQVLGLLREIQASRGITLLFISHDLHTVAAMSREVAVMRAGRIVERGEPGELFANPKNEYTRMLVAAVPHPDPRRRTFRPA